MSTETTHTSFSQKHTAVHASVGPGFLFIPLPPTFSFLSSEGKSHGLQSSGPKYSRADFFF